VSGVTTLMQMFGGCLGSFLGGVLSCVFNLQHLFVLFALPWLAAILIRARRQEHTEESTLPATGEVAGQ